MAEKMLLREWIALDYDPKKLNEDRASRGNGPIILRGIIQKAGVKNQNGRIYPESLLKREMDNYQKAIGERRACGELDHPERSVVNFKEVSHLLRKAWWEGQDVMGEIEVLPTPNGKILESLLGAGVRIGISSRGVGSTEKTNEGADQVNDDFQMITFDIVSEPSTPGAYLFKEGKQVEFDPRKSFTRADRINRALNEILRK